MLVKAPAHQHAYVARSRLHDMVLHTTLQRHQVHLASTQFMSIRCALVLHSRRYKRQALLATLVEVRDSLQPIKKYMITEVGARSIARDLGLEMSRRDLLAAARTLQLLASVIGTTENLVENLSRSAHVLVANLLA